MKVSSEPEKGMEVILKYPRVVIHINKKGNPNVNLKANVHKLKSLIRNNGK